jgi:DNA modification methylase
MSASTGVAWPAAAVQIKPIEALAPRAANARTHEPAQVEQIAALMLEFGWTTAVLEDEDGTLIAGHGRVMAAQLLVSRGHAQFASAPVMTATGWTEAQKRAYVIADNQVALNAGWDQRLLEGEIVELSAAGFDMSLLAFNMADLRRMLRTGGEGLTDPNAAPPVEAVAVSRIGDQWNLGEHRIRCGSSTDVADVSALLGICHPKLMVTDPPYGVEYDPSWRGKATGQKVRAIGKVLNDDIADWREAWALFPGDAAYVWHGGLHSAEVQESLEAMGFEMRAQIIWAKDRFALSRGHFHWRHEPAWYCVRKGRPAGWKGGRKQDTVWRIEGLADPSIEAQLLEVVGEVGAEDTVWEIPVTVDDGSTGHGTQKPVECMARPMRLNSAEGDYVYEPFSGSGSTIIAGEMTARRVLAMELSPAYVDVAVRRWQAFTGEVATLDGDGRSFAALALERAPSEDDDVTAWT